MGNPRGPMVPHEMRYIYDRARLFRSCANALESLAAAIMGQAHTQSEVEQYVVDAESAIQRASIEIRKMKDEPQPNR